MNSSTGFAESIVQMKRMVNLFGSAIIIALVLVSLVIIANTIRAAVFTRRKEINIMKYVGATNGFIRIPFMVEGIVLGCLSAIVSFLLIWAGYAVLLHSINGMSGVSFVANALKNILPFGSVACRWDFLFSGQGLLRVLGSLISVRSHLKV